MSSVIPPLLNSEHTSSGGIHIAFDSLSFDCAILLFGHVISLLFQFSPELNICFHVFLTFCCSEAVPSNHPAVCRQIWSCSSVS
ncbi:hypothetical protein, partial [Ruminococcus callidus]|uniref:hypothetical protein n=1 Tax=Ruminococcus callidus TaxID=40519 RepID=UPI0026F265A7